MFDRQRLDLEGDFGAFFRVFVPSGYARDALFFLTPDVMAACVDHAADFSIEIVDDVAVFFRPGAADFSEPDTWRLIEGVLLHPARLLRRVGGRYRDERMLAGHADPAPERVAPVGKRLGLSDGRRGVRSVLGQVGAVLAVIACSVIPGVILFAGVMSLIGAG